MYIRTRTHTHTLVFVYRTFMNIRTHTHTRTQVLQGSDSGGVGSVSGMQREERCGSHDWRNYLIAFVACLLHIAISPPIPLI